MDRWAPATLFNLLAGACAFGAPLAIGVYSYDQTLGGVFPVPAHSVGDASIALAIGAIIGALIFAPLHRLATRLTRSRTVIAAVLLAVAIDLLLWGAIVLIVPNAPFLKGNGTAQFWGVIVGAAIAGVVLELPRQRKARI